MSDEIVVRFGRAMHLVDITPELAREWLATLPGWDGSERAVWPGGRVDEGKVRRYAEAMRNGTWELMELPIVYRNGRLLSSRNRLCAVVEAGVTVPMYVSDDSCPR